MENKIYRWVKASERLPEKQGKYFIKYETARGIPKHSGCLFNGFEFTAHKYNISWLEPLPEINQEEQRVLWQKVSFDFAMGDTIEEQQSKYILIKR